MDQRSGYDVVASAYARRFRDELRRKPFDVKMLEWLAERARSLGPVCDLGCGPGHIAAHLHSRGADVCGVDLSAEMIRHARAATPEIPFEQGDMRDLSAVGDSAYGGAAALYSIVNIPSAEHPRVFAEMHRVLAPGGWLLLSFHVGEGSTHVDEFLGETVSLDFHFFRSTAIREGLTDAGLDVTEVIEREPYDESVEAQTRRAYLFANKPERAVSGREYRRSTVTS